MGPAVVGLMSPTPHGTAHARRRSQAPTRSNAGASIPNDDDNSPLGPLTDQEREFLEAFRELGEADRVRVWNAILTELGRHADPAEEEARHR